MSGRRLVVLFPPRRHGRKCNHLWLGYQALRRRTRARIALRQDQRLSKSVRHKRFL